MLRAKRQFDDKPAASCMTCGIPIADGEYCLTCVPPSATEGPGSWVNHRWFSGPAAEARKRRIRRVEDLQKGLTTVFALAAALILFGLASPVLTPAPKKESVVAVRHAAKMPWKVAIDATRIS